jgi:2-methylcitrate dehydratase PrpD
LHPGAAARAGVESALLAAEGFVGTKDGIGGPRGFLAAHSVRPKPELLLAGWGKRPLEVRATSIKPHTCCRYNQAAIDALLEIRRREHLDPSDVAHVRVGLPSTAIGIVCEPTTQKRRPRSVVDAQFSLPFGAAVALLFGRAGLPEYDPAVIGDPAVIALMDRVEGVAEPSLDDAYPERWGAWATVTTMDGRELTARVGDSKGDPGNPLTLNELRAKFEETAGPAYGPARCGEITATVARLPEPGTLKELLELLHPDGGEVSPSAFAASPAVPPT